MLNLPFNIKRSPDNITYEDGYLAVSKRLGIPTGPVDSLDAETGANSVMRLFFNTTLNTLRVYDPIEEEWKDATSLDFLNNYYDKVEIDSMFTANSLADRDRANHTGTQPISTIVNLQSTLDGLVPKTTTITGGSGIDVGGSLSSGSVNISINDNYLNNRYLRKNVDDDNGTNTLTLGKLITPIAEIESLLLASLPLGTQADQILTVDTSGNVRRITPQANVDIGIANSGGDVQFSVGAEDDIRFAGGGDTTISFNAATKTLTFTSIPGSGTGGAVTSFNGRTGGVVSVTGDYNTAQVTETTNLYFTEARVRNTPLVGLTLSTTPITATDTIIQAFGKAQGQLNSKVGNSRNLTVSGTAGRIIVSGGEQNLSQDREWVIDLFTSGVSPNVYTKVTVDAYGRVTAGANLAASDIPNLPASKITSGTFALARLGTGTAAAGTYIDGGTGAWTALPSYSAGPGLTLSGTTFSLPITVSGSGNYVSDVTQTTNGITVTKATLPTTDISGLVPYTGANKAVDLNSQNLTNVGTFRAGTTLIPTNTVEVTEKNRSYYLISNTNGSPVAKWETQRWTGTSFGTSNSFGFGYQALFNNTGIYSNGFGYQALQDNTGIQSNGFGNQALQENAGNFSNGVGNYALRNNIGVNSNGFGTYALQNNTGNYSNGFGHSSLQNNTGANSNGFGYLALRYNNGTGNNAFGHNVLHTDPGEVVRNYTTAIGYGIPWTAITKDYQTVFSGREIIGLDLTNARIDAAAGNALVTKDWVSTQIPPAQTLSQPSIGQISISGGNTINLNTVNTSGTQTNIAGDKYWLGTHYFKDIIADGLIRAHSFRVSAPSNSYGEVMWLRDGGLMWDFYTPPSPSKDLYLGAYNPEDGSGLGVAFTVSHAEQSVTFFKAPYSLGTAVNSSEIPTLGQVQSLLPVVNNGQLNIATGAGLTGGGVFTANQSSNSSITIGLSSETQSDIAKGVTAHGWGNHATEGYYKNGDVNIPLLGGDYRVFPHGGVTESFDWNATTDRGFYKNLFNGGAQATYNSPKEGFFGYVENLHYGITGNLTQYAHPYLVADGKWMRSRYDGVWSDWVEFWHSGNLRSNLENDNRYSKNVKVVNSSSAGGGYWLIRIKPASNQMFAFNVNVYQEYEKYQLNVSGYNYTGQAEQWYSPKLTLSHSSLPSVEVRVGWYGDDDLYLVLPRGDYSGITISDIVEGYARNTDWNSIITIEHYSTLAEIPGTIYLTQTVHRPLRVDETANYAHNLATPRNLVIGDTGKIFDGSSNVSWSLSEIGAQPALVSGSNIKTVGGTSVLGSGDIPVVTLDSSQVITGSKSFTSPVYGAPAVSDGQFVTREQVLPLAMEGTGIVRLVHAPRSAIFNSSSTSTSETLKIGNTSTEWEYTMPAGLLSGHSLVEMEFIMELSTTSPTSANEFIPEIMIYDGSTIVYRQLHVLSWQPNRDNRDGSSSIRMKCKITFLNRSGNVVSWTVEGTKSVVQRYWGQPVGGGSNTDIFQRVGVTDYIIYSNTLQVSNNITLKLRKTHPSGVIPGISISILPLTIKTMNLNVPLPDPT